MDNKTYHHGDLRNELIEIGAKLLIEQGLENFSLRKVAKEIGVSHAAPYRHFKNKEDLILEIAKKGIKEFYDALAKPFQEFIDQPKLQLIELGKAYINFAVNNPYLMKILFFSDLKKNIDITKITNINKDGYSMLKKSVKNCITTGETKINDVQKLSLLSWSFVHGLSALMMENVVYFGSASDEMIDQLVRLYINGYFKSRG